MASLIGTLYPPVIDTFMPAFVYTDAVRVYYSLPAYSNLTNITYLHVTLTDQETNQNALENSAGVYIIKNPLQYFDSDKQQYYINLSPSLVKDGVFKCNQFYKVQLRFDCNADGAVPAGTRAANVINRYVMDINNQVYFSEWSTVCLIRPIYKPDLEITGFSNEYGEELNPNINRGVLPISGRLWFRDEEENVNTKEQLRSYQIFIINDKDEELLSTKVIYTSDEFNNNNINTTLNLMNANLNSSTEQTLYLKITYTTGNLYTNNVKLKFNLTPYITNISPFFEHEDNKFRYIIDDENGFVNLIAGFVNSQTITPEENAFFYLMRSSSEDNFNNWQIMFSDYFTALKDYYFEDVSDLLIEESTSISPSSKVVQEATYSELNNLKNYKIIDDTVQSMTWYKYCIQFLIPINGDINNYNLTQPFYFTLDGENKNVFLQFYDLLFSRQGIQVPIRFNPSITSYKKNVARTKIDTLGGKYPKFAENAIMNYRQYSITGTISANMDDMKTFMKKSDYFTDTEVQNLYKEFLINKNIPSILRDEEEENKANIISSFDIDTIGYEYYEWLWERVFREKLYDWLNDGEPKLMRSLPEGNVLVMLTDISLTPNAQLSRLISNFTCTAYEIGDGTSSLDQLRTLGILPYAENTYSPTVIAEKNNTLLTSAQDIPTQVPYSDFFNGAYNIYVQNCRYDINKHEAVNNALLRNLNFVDVIKNRFILDNFNNSNVTIEDFYISDIKITYGGNGAPTLYLKDGVWSDTKLSKAQAMTGHLITLNDNVQIFTNQTTYEIPRDITVTSLKFYEATVDRMNRIHVDCIAHITYGSEEKQKISRVVENIIAQYNEVFHPSEWMNKKIKAEKTYIDSSSNTKTYLKSWDGLYVETSIPYSVYAIKNSSNLTRKDFLVSDENGLLDLSTIGTIKDIAYLGKLMKYDNKEYEYSSDLLDKDYIRSSQEIPNYITNKTQKWLIPSNNTMSFKMAVGTDEKESDNIIDTFNNYNQYILNDELESFNFEWGNIYDNTSLKGKPDWIEGPEVNINIYENPLSIDGDTNMPVPTYWKTVPFININNIVVINAESFVDVTHMTNNKIYNIGGNPYIKINNFVYPVVLLTEDNIAIELNKFENITVLQNTITKIIIPIVEENGYLNYYGKLVKEKRE